jgi:hypothetical protein
MTAAYDSRPRGRPVVHGSVTGPEKREELPGVELIKAARLAQCMPSYCLVDGGAKQPWKPFWTSRYHKRE